MTMSGTAAGLSVLLCITFTGLGLIRPVSTQVVNVALNKPISANITCGFFGEEYFFGHDQEYSPPAERERNRQICYNVTQHPPSAMVDENTDSFWQSTSRSNLIFAGFSRDSSTPDVVISLDLEQLYMGDLIRLTMGNAKRPGSVALLKSIDGVSYQPWIYRVSDEATCTSVFGVPVLYTPRTVSSVVCQGYATRMLTTGEELQFNFASVAPALESWRTLRYLRIQFYGMDLTVSIAAVKFHHYSVTNIEVQAECACNGLQSDCLINQITGQFGCICGGNAAGTYCEQCEPFYNQMPFTPAQECQACNCFSHAEECYYNATIAEQGLSLNANGQRIGGGVCLNCKDNSTGVNCERCVDYFYRPATLQQTDPLACQPCVCFVDGVRRTEDTGLVGDCVMNNDAILPVGLAPGDCFCKPNVLGSRCDQCKTGFFNLTLDKAAGCQACECNAAGTVAGNVICESDALGQCPCKVNVMNRRCDVCVDEFYGLTSVDVDGCQPCGCDPGGAFSNRCDKITGQCGCRGNVIERQCRSPQTGFFYPALDHMSGEFEVLERPWGRTEPNYKGFGYAILGTGQIASTSLRVPAQSAFTESFYIQLRYRSPTIQSVFMSVTQQGTGQVQSSGLTVEACTTGWCYNTGNPFVLARGFTYSVAVDPSADLLLDQAIAMPVQYENASLVLGETLASQFTATCDPLNHQLGVGTIDEQFCMAQAFSLGTFYLNGALPCLCDPTGSFQGEPCSTFGGQCPCKNGVGGRRCDECLLEYYQLSDQGCVPCQCQTADGICDSITGQCLCPPLVAGRQCDQCMINSWNFTSGVGCEPCGCNITGSASLQCDLLTSVCDCKFGVMNDKCDACMPGFKGFSITGCTSCQCNQDGSADDVCDSQTGQCVCKANTQGLLCEQCLPGTYYNDVSHAEGCLPCVCSGVTTQCSSTFLHLRAASVTIQSVSDPTMSNLNLGTETQIQQVDIPLVQVSGIQMAQADLGATATTYWLLPNGGLRGNVLGLYGNKISFVVYYTTLDVVGDPTQPFLVIIGRNNTRFEFDVAPVPLATIQTVEVVVDVAHARGGATREGLLFALTDVQRVLFPAAYYQFAHRSYIGNIRYELADRLGTGERALSVEQCTCPVGYDGLSCENCAPGYRRFNITENFLGLCEPCDCNGHSSACDPDSGACLNCLHNTAGYSCELCADGFYGDASIGTPGDCLACPCYSPRVVNSTCSLQQGRVVCSNCADGYTGDLCNQCLPFYYGNPQVQFTGRCDPCDCNGNSESCNSVTGQCLQCGFNTTGFNCGSCSPGFYGNATARECRSCECNMQGSISNVCEAESGNCTCLAGVGGRTCDRCLENFYGYTNQAFVGCMSCECNEFGSLSLQCNEAGICECATGIEPGQPKCDRCQTRFWGLPAQPCTSCSCDPIGSVDPDLPCEQVTGQCDCKNGVSGRQCDRCQLLYFGYSANGCQACAQCQVALGNDTQRLKDMWVGYYNQAVVVQGIQEQDTILQGLGALINATLNELGMSQDTLTTLTDMLRNLTSLESFYVFNTQALISRGARVQQTALQLERDTLGDFERLLDLLRLAQNALDDVNYMSDNNPLTLNTLAFYNSSAYGLLSLANDIYLNLDMTFDQELASVLQELSTVQSTLIRAQNMGNSVEQQAAQTSSLTTQTQNTQTQFTTLTQQESDISQLLSGVQSQTAQVMNTLNSTLYNKMRAETLYGEAQVLLGMAEASLLQAINNYNTAAQNLQDSLALYNGVPGGLLPVDPALRLQLQEFGISSWQSGAIVLETLINSISNSLENYDALIQATENRASTLAGQSGAILIAFETERDQGQSAVDAINDFEQVVATLNEALQMALQANETMQQTRALLQAISVQDLEARALQALQDSLDFSQAAAFWNATPAALEQGLMEANASLNVAIVQWNDITARESNLLTLATDLNRRANDPSLSDALVLANDRADRAIDTADNVMLLDNQLRPLIDRQQELVGVMQSSVTNASTLDARIVADLNSFQTQLDNNVRSAISAASADYAETNATRGLLENKMALLQDKLEQARARLASLEQPVSFSATSYEVLGNADTGQNMIFTEVTLEFAYSFTPSGLLFFAENPETNEKVLIQLVDGAVVFEVGTVDTVMTAISPAVLCPGCWFRVVATRYANDGQLTVMRLSTGGVATTDFRAQSTTRTVILLTTPVYVGGLPPGYPTAKLYPDIAFSGCIYNVNLNGDTVPLWQSALAVDSQATCCAKPPAMPGPTLVAATTFKGYGFLQIPTDNFRVDVRSMISMEIRTFDPDATVLLLEGLSGSDSYYGVFIQAGYVVFALRTDSGDTRYIFSSRTYNDGSWYKLTAMHNITYAMLRLERVEPLAGEVPDEQTLQGVSLVLESLYVNTSLTLGGQNPNTLARYGPTSSGFAGALRNYQHSTLGDLTLLPQDVQQNAILFTGVIFDEAFEQIVPGLGLDDPMAYATLRNMPTRIETIEFDLLTFEPSSLLVFAQLSADVPNTYFYIGMSNGNILVLFNQGLGTRQPLRTRGNYLSTGQRQRILVDFTFRNSLGEHNPRMVINDETHIGSVTMTQFMFIEQDTVYLGGAPAFIPLPVQEIPVTTAFNLNGGISNLRINGEVIDFFNPDVLTANDQQGVYLSGLSAPPAGLPPLPFTTPPPPPTTPLPTCGPPLAFTPSLEGVRFGDFTQSFMAFDASQDRDIFLTAFSLRLQFRAVQSNGLLFYLASSPLPSPSNYFSLYMVDGFLATTMQSSSFNPFTKNLRSAQRYNDGQWWEVEVLRISDFMAILVVDSRDYVNNGLPGTSNSTLELGTYVYIGGVPTTFGGNQFTAQGGISVGKQPFMGCIRSAMVITHNYKTREFNFTAPVQSEGTTQCYDNVRPGISVEPTSYTRVMSSARPTFNFIVGFQFSVTFSGAGRNGTLMAMWIDTRQYVLLGIVDGSVRLLLGNRGNPFLPFEATSTTVPNAFILCDNEPHVIYFSLTSTGVIMQVDSFQGEVFPFPTTGFVLQPIYFSPLYLGVKDPSWSVAGGFGGVTAAGCIHAVSVNDETFDLTVSQDRRSVLNGCPAATSTPPTTP